MKQHLRILGVTLALLSVVSILPKVSAAAPETETVTATQSVGRTQQVKIYTRMHNGKKQYRVWSVTEGKWLCDWTDYPE